MSNNNTRHICGISGGKDSSALALYLRNQVPQLEYFFCDTGAELPETYAYLEKLQISLGKKIHFLNSKRGFDHYFKMFRGTLPSPQMRWCTNYLKIEPLETWIGDESVISYVAIRADEAHRKGYKSTKSNIQTVFPFIENNLNHEDILGILDDAGLGLPDYYKWRTRSGCYFCFFQRKAEWIGLHKNHPDLWEKAVAIEQKMLINAGHDGSVSYDKYAMQGRQYTWSSKETLSELLAREEEILSNHQNSLSRAKKLKVNRPAWEVFAEALNEDDDTEPCIVCNL